MKKIGCLLIFFFFIISSAAAQNIIKGTVRSAKTGKVLLGVNVYLSKTTIGDATNKEGEYVLETSETGVFNLVFNMIGYKEKIIKIALTTSKSIQTINATLQRQTSKMKSIVVTGTDENWKEHFNFFRKAFIGQTEFAKKTSIKNPYHLHFSKIHHRLIAKSSRPLIIMNAALGYKIIVKLDKFSFVNPIEGRYIIFPRYVELIPLSHRQAKLWQNNRWDTFRRSLKHFLKILYRHNLNKTHFRIKYKYNLTSLSEGETVLNLLHRGMSSQRARTFKGFKLAHRIQVSYGNYISAIKCITKDHTFYINKKGDLLNPVALKLGGYWGRNRLANTLPLNYPKYFYLKDVLKFVVRWLNLW